MQRHEVAAHQSVGFQARFLPPTPYLPYWPLHAFSPRLVLLTGAAMQASIVCHVVAQQHAVAARRRNAGDG
jgi:hypothetical protein